MSHVLNRQYCCIALIAVVAFLFSCSREDHGAESLVYPVLPETPYDYAPITLPEHFASNPLIALIDYDGSNPVTDHGATLGRVLFYDVNLSANKTTSCGSCHHQSQGFTDAKKLSRGHTGLFTKRNSSHIVNARFTNRFFWDNRVSGLENQVLMPIQDELEMGMILPQLVERLQSIPYYPPLFEAAFGDPSIDADRISRALAQFVRSMVSFTSRYDEGAATGFANFTEQELQGMALFQSGETECNHCHVTANFHANDALNNGLDLEYADNGRGEITGNESDNGKFKTPSLRNVALTAPYMHDGRFNTLEEVIDHYSHGVKQHPNLDDRLTVSGTTGGTPKVQNFTQEEKSAIIAFLHTLTDELMISDPKFANPFPVAN